MKIGFLTFHRANNLGAVLQTFALQKFLKDANYDVEIIDYLPNNEAKYYQNKVIRFIRNIKAKINDIILSKDSKTYKLNMFRNNNFTLSYERYYGDDDILQKKPKYDFLISGSDQILNTTLTGNSKAYYLFFDKNTRKISYASSFGREDVTEDEKKLIRNELSSFSDISVREISAVKIIQREIGVRPDVVLDPVFLLSKNSWNDKCNRRLDIPKKYIFVYAMESSKAMSVTLSIIQKEYNIPIILVKGGNFNMDIGIIIDNCGPEDFLQYIKNAEFIVTNSFHGTAFGMIFGKQFICVAHSKRNTRLESIMTLVNARNAIVESIDILDIKDYIVNGEESYKSLSVYINNSKQYLKNKINN